MRLPTSRGPLSRGVRGLLRDGVPRAAPALAGAAAVVADPLRDGDFQLALAMLYELHYRGFDGVDDGLEWDPDLLRLRAAFEARFERAVRDAVGEADPALLRLPVDLALRALVDGSAGPALSAYLLRHATLREARDFLRQRSVYHLKEADPHTWMVPRLHGRAKAALVEVQADEYGGGRADRMHAALFARSMRALGLDDGYGAYWDDALPEVLAATNLMSLLGLHRRHRGALLGHLACLEMTSTEPNRRYANGFRRLGLGPEATAFFDVHVVADAVHEQVAAVDMCGAFVADEPDRAADVLHGAGAAHAVDSLSSTALLRRWGAVLADERAIA